MIRVCIKQGCLCILLLAICLLSGCARGPDPQDPYEHFNRNTYRLNDDIDTVILKPIAEGYNAITNYPIRRSVSNFFTNMATPGYVVNDILQGHVYWTMNDTWRFMINSSVGVLGIFDVASDIGIKKHKNYLGLTLTRWGYKKPPYVVVPFMGPNTTAGLAEIPLGFKSVPWRYQFEPTSLRVSMFSINMISKRASYLSQQDLASQLSFDPYIFMRTAFMQNRRYLIKLNDNPPLENTVAAAEAETALKENDKVQHTAIKKTKTKK